MILVGKKGLISAADFKIAHASRIHDILQQRQLRPPGATTVFRENARSTERDDRLCAELKCEEGRLSRTGSAERTRHALVCGTEPPPLWRPRGTERPRSGITAEYRSKREAPAAVERF